MDLHRKIHDLITDPYLNNTKTQFFHKYCNINKFVIYHFDKY